MTETVSSRRRLVAESGSALLTINLGGGQAVHIANITTSELRSSNFIFAIPVDDDNIAANPVDDSHSITPFVVGVTLGGILVIFLLFKFGNIVMENKRIEDLKKIPINWESASTTNPTYVSFVNQDSQTSVLSGSSSERDESQSDTPSDESKSSVEDVAIADVGNGVSVLERDENGLKSDIRGSFNNLPPVSGDIVSDTGVPYSRILHSLVPSSLHTELIRSESTSDKDSESSSTGSDSDSNDRSSGSSFDSADFEISDEDVEHDGGDDEGVVNSVETCGVMGVEDNSDSEVEEGGGSSVDYSVSSGGFASSNDEKV
jgi:hypothetical protein